MPAYTVGMHVRNNHTAPAASRQNVGIRASSSPFLTTEQVIGVHKACATEFKFPEDIIRNLFCNIPLTRAMLCSLLVLLPIFIRDQVVRQNAGESQNLIYLAACAVEKLLQKTVAPVQSEEEFRLKDAAELAITAYDQMDEFELPPAWLEEYPLLFHMEKLVGCIMALRRTTSALKKDNLERMMHKLDLSLCDVD